MSCSEHQPESCGFFLSDETGLSKKSLDEVIRFDLAAFREARVKIINLSAIVLAAHAMPAAAQTVDGQNTGGNEYAGGSTATVATNPLAPNGNFGTPTNQSTAGYTINLLDTNGSLFGLVSQTGGESVGPFANLYFDLDRTTRSGSDLGFEIGLSGVNAFVPGVAGSVALGSSLFNVVSTSSGGLTIFEFRLANSVFNSPIAGLNYNSALIFSGDNRLNLSQSLGYSVAGGQTFYGNDRLGTFSTAVTAVVPEPTTWAMMILGFGAIGISLRATKRRSNQKFDTKKKGITDGARA